MENNKQLEDNIKQMLSGLEGISSFIEQSIKKALSNMPKDQIISQAEQLNKVQSTVKHAEKQTQDQIKELKRTLNL